MHPKAVRECMPRLTRDLLNFLTLAGFGLILLSFFVRGLGQFVVGPRRVLQIAAPIALLAFAVLVAAVVLWTLDRLDVLALDGDPE